MNPNPPVHRLRAPRSASSVFDVPIRPGERFRLHAGDTVEYVLEVHANGGRTLRRADRVCRGKAAHKDLKRQRRAAREHVAHQQRQRAAAGGAVDWAQRDREAVEAR